MPATKPDPTQRLIRAVVAGMEYDPGHSDLNDEQPVWVRLTLGDYRLACQLRTPDIGEYRVTFLAEDGHRTVLGNQGVLSLAAAARIVRENNEEDSTAECRVEHLINGEWKEVLCDQIAW